MSSPVTLTQQSVITLEMLQGLYMQGFTPEQIESQTGIKAANISWHASTKGWHEARQAANSLLAETPLEFRAARLKDNLVQVAEHHADRMAANPPKDDDTMAKQASVLKQVVDASSKLLGWDKDKSPSSINILVLSTDPSTYVKPVDV